jgi:thiol-disulfide isomerase/thioredoxin
VRRFLLLIATLFFAQLAIAAPDAIKPFQRGDWNSLINSSAKPMVVHFWGVTCAPCAREMPEWGKFLTKNTSANVMFIQVDEVTPEMASKMLAKANLLSANNYNLASPFDEYLRHEIDPKWRGETPISILIGKNGKVIRKTGPMDFQQLQNWFKSQS